MLLDNDLEEEALAQYEKEFNRHNKPFVSADFAEISVNDESQHETCCGRPQPVEIGDHDQFAHWTWNLMMREN